MIYRPDYDENGKKVLCEMNGVNPEMLMDIYVKKLKKGETLEILEEKAAQGVDVRMIYDDLGSLTTQIDVDIITYQAL